MSANTRKPICPACHGVGSWPATHLDPSEECEVCNGAGRVSKRTEVRFNKRASARRMVTMSCITRQYTAGDGIEF